MATQILYAECRYNAECDEDKAPAIVGKSALNDDTEFTIKIDKAQSDPDQSADKNSGYDDTYSHTNNIQSQQPHNSYRKQNQYPPNHYGYDIQQKEHERHKAIDRSDEDHSDVKDSGGPIGNISEVILASLPHLHPPPSAATEETLHQERQLHPRTIVATDSAVSLTGDDILASPGSTNIQPCSNTISSAFSSPSISTYQRQTTSPSGSNCAGPRSTNFSATAMNGCDIPVPPLPPQYQPRHRRSPPSGLGIAVNVNASSPSVDVPSNPPSPRKIAWESETPTTRTPQLHKGITSHHHSSSLFDFFRTRKSISKNSAHQASAIAAANTSSVTSSTPPLPTNLPLMSTTPTIAKSRAGAPHHLSYAPSPPRKQSLDLSVLSEYQPLPSSFSSPLTKHDRHASTMPIIPSSTMTPSSSTMTPSSSTSSFTSSQFQSPHASSCAALSHQSSLTNTAHSTLSKVAAVVGATIGRRRGSVTAEVLELGQGPDHTKAHEPSNQSQIRQELGPTQLNDHARILKEAKTSQELIEYIDKLYCAVLNGSVALEHANKQVSEVQEKLDQTRCRAEEDRKSLVAEADRVKEQIVTVERNFLLWRTKVHNDQIAQQNDYLNERLVLQDRIEELEDELNTSQDEVVRLRRRLLILEYEDGYVGPISLLIDDPLTSRAIENSPMTVATHKRRSADFKILEMKAQNYEHQVQDLLHALETERQDRQKDFVEFRMRMHAKVVKLEEEVQAAKMESSIYTEMMHEIVTENDALRTKVKQAQRKSRIEDGSSTSFGSSTQSHQDFYSHPGFDDSSDSMYSSDDEMEEITIS